MINGIRALGAGFAGGVVAAAGIDWMRPNDTNEKIEIPKEKTFQKQMEESKWKGEEKASLAFIERVRGVRTIQDFYVKTLTEVESCNKVMSRVEELLEDRIQIKALQSLYICPESSKNRLKEINRELEEIVPLIRECQIAHLIILAQVDAERKAVALRTKEKEEGRESKKTPKNNCQRANCS